MGNNEFKKYRICYHGNVGTVVTAENLDAIKVLAETERKYLPKSCKQATIRNADSGKVLVVSTVNAFNVWGNWINPKDNFIYVV